MRSAFLGALQATFVADSIHHDLAFCSEEVGCQNKQNCNDTEERCPQPRGSVLKFQTVECQGCHKQCSHQQDHAGITETEKGLEELHRVVAQRKSEHSYGANSVGEQGQNMLDMIIQPTQELDAAESVTSNAVNPISRRRQLHVLFNPLLKTQSWQLISAPVM